MKMNDIFDLMRARHSVRQYLDDTIPDDIRTKLREYAEELEGKGELGIQIIYDEPDCFGSFRARYGSFKNCRNYISLVGKKKDPGLEERCGYFGELMVLKAQELGLNTCWVALTHGKSRAVIGKDETEVILISLGYGKTQGTERKCKTAEEVSNVSADSPEWFRRGVEAALLAPTAVNQQKFKFTLDKGRVRAECGKIGPCLKIDLGIVKCHFELAAGKDNFKWA